jgi:Lon protease-like protein
MSEHALSDFSGIARLFPLPNLVLFPHVIQGLHIFEPRYRQMTNDAITGDGFIAIVMLRPNAEEVADCPPIESVACLGQIIWHETLPGGKYNLRVRGASRVRIVEEVPTEKLYRSARVELLPDAGPSDLAMLTQLRRELAAAVLPRFSEDSPARRQLQELFDGDTPLGGVCDILAYALPLPVELKQSLLAEQRIDRRAASITETLRISAARADRPFPPPFSSN